MKTHTAAFFVIAGNLPDAFEQARRIATEFFQEENITLTQTHAEREMNMAGETMYWRVFFDAERISL